MAELADAPDLGSGGRPCRFKSCYPQDKGFGLFRKGNGAKPFCMKSKKGKKIKYEISRWKNRTSFFILLFLFRPEGSFPPWP